jgi:hypothetical protein
LQLLPAHVDGRSMKACLDVRGANFSIIETLVRQV